MTNNPRSQLIKHFERFTPVHYVVATGNGIELLYMHGDNEQDPRYWLIDASMKIAVLGLTGLVESMCSVNNYEKKTVLSRPNAYGNFMLAKSADFLANPQQSFDIHIDSVYNKLNSLIFQKDYQKLENRFDWDCEKLAEWFRDSKTLYHERDIIPEYNDTMVIIQVSEGCKGSCNFCTMPGNARLYTKEQIKKSFQ